MSSSGADKGTNGAGSAHLHPKHLREETSEPLPPPPPAVAELVAACVRFVTQKYKVSLDGTPETLSLLDQYVRDARDAVRERPESIDLPPSEIAMRVVAPAVGAYLGELARRTFGAEWFAEGDHDGWRLYFTSVYLAYNPIGVAHEALTMREEGGWHAHLLLDPGEKEIIEERLAIIPEVEEEEYYLPSTHFEMLAIVVETLRARAEQSGTGDVRFTPDDYD